MIFFAFLFGLIVGSFLNSILYRLRYGGNIVKERSHCPKCSHVLGVWDLIPLMSFLFLRGRCRYCKRPIEGQYFLVEFFTGLAFALIIARFGFFPLTVLHLSFLAYLFSMTSFLIIIFVYDLRYFLISDSVVLPAMMLAILGEFFILHQGWKELFVAALVGGGFFLLQHLVSRGKWVGEGDIRMGVLMGLILGLEKTLFALLLAYVFGALVGITLLALKKKALSSQIAFGTFLSSATWVSLLWGEDLITWYLKFFI